MSGNRPSRAQSSAHSETEPRPGLMLFLAVAGALVQEKAWQIPSFAVVY